MQRLTDRLVAPFGILVLCAIAIPGLARGADWRVRLEFAAVVDGEPHRVTPLTIGVAAGATNAFDRRTDLLAPPPPPGGRYVEAHIHRPNDAAIFRRLNTDIRAIPQPDGTATRWEIVVVNPTDTDWTMSWDASAVPEEWRHVVLTGEDSDEALDMRMAPMITVPQSISCVYVVTVARDVSPQPDQHIPEEAIEAKAPESIEASVGKRGQERDVNLDAQSEALAVPDTPGDETTLPADRVAATAEVTLGRTPDDVTDDGVLGIEDLVCVAQRIDADVAETQPADIVAGDPLPEPKQILPGSAAEAKAPESGEVTVDELGKEHDIGRDTPPKADVADDIPDDEATLPTGGGVAAAEVTVERTPEDVTGDGTVGIEDLVYVARRVGADVVADETADIDGDGEVTIRDLLYVAAAMRRAGAAPSRRALGTDAARFVAGGISAEEFARLIASVMPYGRTRLLPNYPNPFNPETWIPFDLAEAADVIIRIYDARGIPVRTLKLGRRSAQAYHTRDEAAYWNGTNDVGEPVTSGVYVYELRVGEHREMRRMVVRK